MKSPFKADFKHTPRFADCETQDFKNFCEEVRISALCSREGSVGTSYGTAAAPPATCAAREIHLNKGCVRKRTRLITAHSYISLELPIAVPVLLLP